MVDYRIPAIDEQNRKFTVASNDGTIEVDLIEVIGRGGSCIAYKAEKRVAGASPRAVVVKEYYPQEQDILHGVSYIRRAAGEEIHLETKQGYADAASKEQITKEKKRQKDNVKREIDVTHQLSYDPKNVQNNAYAFNADYISERGDSSYIVIDTTEGCTLRKLLHEFNGRIGIEKAIEYTRELLMVAEKVLFRPQKSFCHGDIKPETIFMAGMNPSDDDALEKAPRIVLLDFGSVFRPEDYKSYAKDIETIIRAADKILYNEGIGCSSVGYRSELIQEVFIQKQEYASSEKDPKYAAALVNTINRINCSVDLYSIIQCFFECAIGKVYPGDVPLTARKIKRICDMDDAVADQMIKMGEKNRLGEYISTKEIMEDLDVLAALLRKDADPRVLLDEITKELSQFEDYEIEEDLLGEVELG